MKLLKIGSLDIPKTRWLDALNTFEKVIVICEENENEILNPNLVYIKLKFYNSDRFKFVDKVIKKVLFKLIGIYPNNFIFSKLTYFYLKLTNMDVLKSIRKLEYDYIHVSYNDLDQSGLMLLIIHDYLRKDVLITRAYKETRLKRNYFEMISFKLSNRIILNSNENLQFFRVKYPYIEWEKKEIILNLDEDWRSERIVNDFTPKDVDKLSSIDNQIHLVLLAGTLLSSWKEKRSGGRLYYVDYFVRLLQNPRIVLHLHYFKIVPNKNGFNPYLELKKIYPQRIFFEKPLDFENDTTNSYKILSKYDYGILHAFKEKSAVTIFDKVNIPHKFYEYMIAGVQPIIEYNSNLVIEKLVIEHDFGLIFKEVSDINFENLKKISKKNSSFDDYISELYQKI